MKDFTPLNEFEIEQIRRGIAAGLYSEVEIARALKVPVAEVRRALERTT